MSRGWRPTLEQLESRLVPSAAPPLPAHPEHAPPLPGAQVAQDIVAIVQAVQLHAGPVNTAMPLAGVATQPLLPLPTTPAPAPPADVPLSGFLVLSTEEAQPSLSPGLAETEDSHPSTPPEPITAALHAIAVQNPAIEAPPAEEEAPPALLSSAEESEPPALAPVDAETAPPAAPAVRDDLPLFAWVTGMTCLLMLRWESRKATSVGLAPART